MKTYSIDELKGFQELLKPYRRDDGGFSYAVLAKRLGERRTTWQHRAECVIAAEQKGELGIGFEMADLPDEVASIPELLARRRKEFERRKAARTARKLIPVSVKVDGPYAVAHFGDPHVDDPGCNIELLERHVKIVADTPAMFAGNIGDLQNNWIGRLERLYGKQGATAKEAWKLVEWLMTSMPWLYVVFGNHDLWSGDRDPLEYILKHAPGAKGAWGTRLQLVPPKGRATRINARHDFRGRSEWNTTHGPSKAAQMGWRDHVLICGHHHTSGYQMVRCPASGLISHVVRVSGYKNFDDYAEEKGLPDQACFPSCVTVIDPSEPDDSVRHVTFFADLEHGAEYLTFLRKKRGF
jgi:hypothetical protein